jgi:hypothetical protein
MAHGTGDIAAIRSCFLVVNNDHGQLPSMANGTEYGCRLLGNGCG